MVSTFGASHLDARAKAPPDSMPAGFVVPGPDGDSSLAGNAEPMPEHAESIPSTVQRGRFDTMFFYITIKGGGAVSSTFTTVTLRLEAGLKEGLEGGIE